MKAETQIEKPVGSQVPASIPEVQLQPSAQQAVKDLPNAFTTFFTHTFHGELKGTFFHPSVTADSRVFVSMGEIGHLPQVRFLGDARMAVYNVIAFDGGLRVWCEVFWPTNINIRFDVLVDN